MTVQSLVFQALTAYVSTITAAVPSAVVYDGPQVTVPTEQHYIIVGCDDAQATSLVNAVSNGAQQWESLGASRRMEQFTIPAVIVAWNGNADLPAARALIQADIDAIGAALRPTPAGTGDAMLGNVLNQGGAGWCGLSVARVQQDQSSRGGAVHCQIDLNCVAYL